MQLIFACQTTEAARKPSGQSASVNQTDAGLWQRKTFTTSRRSILKGRQSGERAKRQTHKEDVENILQAFEDARGLPEAQRERADYVRRAVERHRQRQRLTGNVSLEACRVAALIFVGAYWPAVLPHVKSRHVEPSAAVEFQWLNDSGMSAVEIESSAVSPDLHLDMPTAPVADCDRLSLFGCSPAFLPALPGFSLRCL